MAFLSQRGTCGRGNKVVVRETAPVFAGRYHGIFHAAVVPVLLRRDLFLRGGVPDDPVPGRKVSDLARSGAGLDHTDVRPAPDQRRAASVRGDPGTVSGPDLSGGEEPVGLSAKRDG